MICAVTPYSPPDALGRGIPGGLRDGREVYYRGERVEDVVAHPELGLAARHGTLDFHGPSPDPSPYYTIPRSTARQALVADAGDVARFLSRAD